MLAHPRNPPCFIFHKTPPNICLAFSHQHCTMALCLTDPLLSARVQPTPPVSPVYYPPERTPVFSSCAACLLLSRNPPCSIFQDPGTSHCGSGWTPAQLALYNAGTRPAWGFALILLCFVCFNGQVGDGDGHGIWRVRRCLFFYRGLVCIPVSSVCGYI